MDQPAILPASRRAVQKPESGGGIGCVSSTRTGPADDARAGRAAGFDRPDVTFIHISKSPLPSFKSDKFSFKSKHYEEARATVEFMHFGIDVIRALHARPGANFPKKKEISPKNTIRRAS
ncbi:hypothetical protein [Paraburkholderia sp. J63]|uniref:hypothetical protein n=1 Tax=Paraburkholderia sp. J63 TaxID=2805434 RepID=UPI002ABE408A|nr:hypothetical protein [Paraburkholderia sp. J63]